MKTYIVSGWIDLESFNNGDAPDYQTSISAKTDTEAQTKATRFWADQGIVIDTTKIES